MQQVRTCFSGLKSEINKLCKNGEYDIDTFQKIAIDLSVVQKALDNLDLCQNVLLTIAKNNSQGQVQGQTLQTNQPFDPNGYQDLKVTPKIYEP
jgi:hypothetical protein